LDPEGSLSYSQEPSTGPYPETDESTPYIPTLFPKDHLAATDLIRIHWIILDVKPVDIQMNEWNFAVKC